MKSKIVLIALIVAPWLLGSAAKAQPVRIAKAPAEPLPDAQQLFDNLFAPYRTARTFRGKFDITIAGERNLVEKIQLDALFRADEQGNLSGQKSRMKITGRTKPKAQQTFVFVDEGAAQKMVMVEQKAWWMVAARDNDSALTNFVRPLIEQVIAGLEDDDKFEPVVSRGMEAGRAVLVLKAKKGNGFRAVLDEQTRAILSLQVKDSISMTGSEQSFDQPLSDDELAWTAPADYRQVAPGAVAPPASLGIGAPGTPATSNGNEVGN